MAYIEPAPLLDKENPFEAMMSRFQTASQILGLEEQIYNVLKVPARQVIVSLPVTMERQYPRFRRIPCYSLYYPWSVKRRYPI